MKYAIRMTSMIGIAIGTLAISENRLFAQGAEPNAAPNPYKLQEVRSVGQRARHAKQQTI